MFEKATQFIHMPSFNYLCKCYCSVNPAVNFFCWWTVIIFSNTPAVDGDETAAQFFVGYNTKLVSVQTMNNTADK